MIEGRLSYNQDEDRYGVLVGDLWHHTGLHCGDTLEVMLPDGTWTPARMEMDSGIWYLVGAPYVGDGLEYVRVRI